jgi:hypothetical protein
MIGMEGSSRRSAEIDRRWETLRILIDELTRSAIAPLGGVSLGFVLASTAPDQTATQLDVIGRQQISRNEMQTESLGATEKRTLEMIADGASLKDVLTHLCDSIDVQVSPSVTSVLLMERDGKHLVLTAGPKVPPEWVCSLGPVPVCPGRRFVRHCRFLENTSYRH